MNEVGNVTIQSGKDLTAIRTINETINLISIQEGEK